MGKHTPGRWFAERIYVLSDYSILEDNLPTVLCKATNDADARLMAAAPELLQALETLADQYQYVCQFDPAYEAAMKVIKKARGETE